MEIRFRPWRFEDAQALAAQANQPEIARNLRDVFPYPYTLESARAFIDNCMHADPAQELLAAITADGAVAGSIGLTIGKDVYRKSAELGYWLGKQYWGHGIAARAVRWACDTGFRRYDIIRIHAAVFDYNIASQRVLEKCGFSREGILRKSVYKENALHDSVLYALLK